MAGLGALAASIAQKFGIPPSLFQAQIAQEAGSPGDLSGNSWNTMAVGTSGELGLGQLMPSIVSQYGVANAFDPSQNLTGAAAYLRDLYNRYGNWNAALSAYNSGSPTSALGQQYANSIIGASGLTGTTPGIQPVPATNSNPGAATGSGASPGIHVSGWGYVLAIGLVVILVIAGLVGVVREA